MCFNLILATVFAALQSENRLYWQPHTLQADVCPSALLPFLSVLYAICFQLRLVSKFVTLSLNYLYRQGPINQVSTPAL